VPPPPPPPQVGAGRGKVGIVYPSAKILKLPKIFPGTIAYLTIVFSILPPRVPFFNPEVNMIELSESALQLFNKSHQYSCNFPTRCISKCMFFPEHQFK